MSTDCPTSFPRVDRLHLHCRFWIGLVHLCRLLGRRRCPPPKSGDITRCVNVVDNLGVSPVRMDNQQRFVDKTMIWHCKTFNNVKLAFVLTFIVSLGTNLFTNKLWWKHAGHEPIRLLKRLIRKAVRLEDSLFILAYISHFNNWLKHLQSQSSVGMFFNSLKATILSWFLSTAQ